MLGQRLRSPDMGGATEIIHRADLNADKIAKHTKDYEDRFANPLLRQSGVY